MRRRLFYATTAALVAFALIPAPSAEAVTTPAPEYLVNNGSGRCLSVAYSGTQNWSKANHWDCLNVPAQRWRMVPVGSSANSLETQHYQIVNDNPAAHNKCLSLNGDEAWMGNGAGFHLWDCLGDHPYQTFYFRSAGNGTFTIVLTGTNKCLRSSTYGNSAAGISQYSCNRYNGLHQWRLSSYSAAQRPLENSGGGNPGVHGPPYDNPWATDMFSWGNESNGEDVRLMVAGKVIKRGWIGGCGYGVRIEDVLDFNYLYCHGETSPSLSVGHYYPAGTYLFQQGNSGTGAEHLHFEIMWRPPAVSTSSFSLSSGFVPYCANFAVERVYNNQWTVPSHRKGQAGSYTHSSNPSGLGSNCRW